jgi:tRNA A-37 threonylcarbamoyl transferase component Bud32
VVLGNNDQTKLAIVADAISELKKLHEHKFVHGDLELRNIVVDEENKV